MRVSALATDYDGTIARDGKVRPQTVQSLQSFKAAGKRMLLVTGRELRDLATVFDRFDLFDIVVAENGGLLFWPGTKAEEALAPRPDPRFIERLRQRDVSPLSVGRVIVATLEPNRAVVDELIDELGLDLHIVMNKGSTMILPSGVDKALGLQAALSRMGIPPLEVAGIGDAENDFPFLRICGYSAATANALPFLKTQVSWTTPSSHGAGVEEFIDQLLSWERSQAVGE